MPTLDVLKTWSEGIVCEDDVRAIVVPEIPGACFVEKATQADDRDGTDYWLMLTNGQRLSVDTKVRRQDYKATKGEDDLALETWSVVESRVPGWTRDPTKRTDFILWYWPTTRRWCLVPFRPLCRVFIERWEKWRKRYPCYRQETTRVNGTRYHSECMLVPRVVVRDELVNVLGLGLHGRRLLVRAGR